MRHFHQALRCALDRADGIHAAGIAMPAVEDIGDVDVDDVAIAQRLVVGNTMTNDMVDRGAAGFGVAAIVERGGQGAVIHAEFENEAVDGVGGHAGLYHAGKFIQATCGKLASLAHAGKALLVVEPDLAGVAQRGCFSVEIGNHGFRKGFELNVLSRLSCDTDGADLQPLDCIGCKTGVTHP